MKHDLQKCPTADIIQQLIKSHLFLPEMEKKKEKRKSKKKLESDEKVIKKARNFVNEPKTDVNDEMDEEKTRMKEIKREKMHLKRQKKKEEKLKQFKKRETNEFAKSAISYLHLWNDNKHAWTFKKKLQIWLLNHIYDEQKVIIVVYSYII